MARQISEVKAQRLAGKPVSFGFCSLLFLDEPSSVLPLGKKKEEGRGNKGLICMLSIGLGHCTTS